MELIAPRETSLGAGLTVRRTLPARGHTTIGAWCFVDHYGPTQLAMDIGPHPHTELQTASWLFSGEVEHRDSAGHHATIRAGELNLMTAGSGISHSEISPHAENTRAKNNLHGVQLWIALPSDARHVDPGFEHVLPAHIDEPTFNARVFIGSLFGVTTPATTYSPLLGAELNLAAGAEVTLELDPSFEHGVLVDHGDVRIQSTTVPVNELAYLPPGEHRVTLRARTNARLLVLGGEPFGEQIVMWWNFIGRSHDDIVAYRQAWQSGQIAVPANDPTPRVDAPELPRVTLKPR